MSAYLKSVSPTGELTAACGAVTTIGRDRANDIVLPDLQVSRQHAIIRRLGKADYYFIDSGSSNGSRVNGRRITMPTLLADGDEIAIGNTTLRFEQPAQALSFSDSLSAQATVIMDEPVIREVTLLVADIRGFTRLSEQMPIRTLTRLMSNWFEQASEAIVKNGGTVDKFIGDCVFARWEGDGASENVLRALRTACLLRDETAGLHRHFSELSEPLYIGVGINTGMASIGVGSDNTVLGDAVNVAFRLESASKELGVDVVLSEAACDALPLSCAEQAPHSLKLRGRAKAVKAVALNFAQVEQLLAQVPAG